jgi:hypothetical protein
VKVKVKSLLPSQVPPHEDTRGSILRHEIEDSSGLRPGRFIPVNPLQKNPVRPVADSLDTGFGFFTEDAGTKPFETSVFTSRQGGLTSQKT